MMSVDEREQGIGATIALAKRLATGTSYRPMFVVPAERGICLPNAHIRNDNDEIRDIATTYRLSAHPDVTIWMEDSTEIKGSVHLAGKKGLSSFVTITRRDGSVDFGYFASARGEFAKHGVPNVNVYVITRSSDAKSKNVTPLDEKDFMELVSKVTGSIRLRVFNQSEHNYMWRRQTCGQAGSRDIEYAA